MPATARDGQVPLQQVLLEGLKCEWRQCDFTGLRAFARHPQPRVAMGIRVNVAERHADQLMRAEPRPRTRSRARSAGAGQQGAPSRKTTQARPQDCVLPAIRCPKVRAPYRTA